MQRKNGLSPSGGIIFDATNNLSIFANYARGEQATFTAAKDGSILPNIITNNKEAGVKLDLFGKRATINASYFDIQQDNIIVRDPADPTNLFPGPGQRGRGIDLNIAGQLLPGWSVLASLTRTKYALLTTNSLQTVVANQPRDTYSVYSTYRTKIAEGVSGGVSGAVRPIQFLRQSARTICRPAVAAVRHERLCERARFRHQHRCPQSVRPQKLRFDLAFHLCAGRRAAQRPSQHFQAPVLIG
ncbi:TonB-dependent receptor [Sphingomonas sp. I4]